MTRNLLFFGAFGLSMTAMLGSTPFTNAAFSEANTERCETVFIPKHWPCDILINRPRPYRTSLDVHHHT